MKSKDGIGENFTIYFCSAKEIPFAHDPTTQLSKCPLLAAFSTDQRNTLYRLKFFQPQS